MCNESSNQSSSTIFIKFWLGSELGEFLKKPKPLSNWLTFSGYSNLDEFAGFRCKVDKNRTLAFLPAYSWRRQELRSKPWNLYLLWTSSWLPSLALSSYGYAWLLLTSFCTFFQVCILTTSHFVLSSQNDVCASSRRHEFSLINRLMMWSSQNEAALMLYLHVHFPSF